MRAAVFPDAEAVAVTWLRARVNVTVATDLIGWQAGQSRVVITRIGGVPTIPYRLDNPRIDVACWAATKSAAHDLAQNARAVLHELPSGDHTGYGAVVAHVEDETGIGYVPDPDTQTSRYIFTLRLSIHPYP